MTKTKLSVRRSRGRQEKGLYQFALEWLNHPKTPEEAAAVQKLKQMLIALHGLRAKADRGEVIYRDEVLPINEYLAGQKWITQIFPKDKDTGFVFLNGPALHDAPFGDMEYLVAKVVVELASKGKLERVQCCAACGIWFNSKRLGAHYHNDACRKKAHDQTPAAKRRRRRYDEACSVAAAREQLKNKKKRRIA